MIGRLCLGSLLRTTVALVAVLLAVCPTTAATLKDETIRTGPHVKYLASDSLEGRLPGTPGIEKAASYIAEKFEASGLEPAFGDSYFQEFMIQLGFMVTEGPFLQFGDNPPVPAEAIGVVPISGSGGVDTGRLSGERPSWNADEYAGGIVFGSIPDEVEEQRWTMMGRDGLLEYMMEEASKYEELGAGAVVFMTDPGERGAGVHHFPLRRSYRQVGVPVFEAAREALLSAGMKGKGAWPCSLRVAVEARTIKVRNVGCIRRGAATPDEYLVVGAHYDHLGYGDIASSTPWRREIHNGADDNASGVAALLEIAKRTGVADPLDRSVVFVSFTAEELGAQGSEYYCNHPPFPIENTIAMINLDTVGRMEDRKLIVFGARSADEISGVLTRSNRYDLEVIEKEEIYGFSDQNPFYARGIPSLHFFTGAYDDYHSPDDDFFNINFDELSRLTNYVLDVTHALADIQQLTPVIDAEEPSPPEMSRGSGAFLGIVPDFAYSGTGVGLKGTVPESPAEAAGLQDGDVIVSIDGKTIADLRALMHFLAAGKPGDEIEIRIMRGSAPDVKKATLSVRSSRKQSE